MTTILNKEKILEQARIYADEGKYDKAIAEYEKILTADAADLRVKLRVAELYTKRKQITEAIRIYREVADAYSGEGFYLKAVTVLKNILRLNPTLVDVNQMLAELYERMGLIADAIRQYSILATTLDQKGDGEKALEIRRKIVDLDPASEDSRVKLAEILQREGKAEEAVDQYAAMAKLYEAQGKKDLKLADMYEKVLAHRDDEEMLKALCRIYDALGEKKKILKWAEHSKSLAQVDPELLGMLARIYASLNQIETARSKYLMLADIEKNEGHLDEALNAYAEIIMLMPGEDEKIFKRAEEIREGAVEELKAIVEKRRKETADLEKKKDEEKRRKDEEVKRKEEEAKKAAEGKKAKPAKSTKAAEPVPSKQAPAPALKPQPPPVSDEVKIKEADQAFDLGNAYWKMGLTDEAKLELEKARRIYEDMIAKGGRDEPKARQRLNMIATLLKGKQAEAKVEVKSQVEVKVPKKEEKKVEVKVEIEKESEKKKKISFV